jgi:hypothetical protein
MLLLQIVGNSKGLVASSVHTRFYKNWAVYLKVRKVGYTDTHEDSIAIS